MRDEQAPPEVTEAILGAVDTQLQENSPPEARATLDRLIAQGHTEEEARRLIAAALVCEMSVVLQSGKPHDVQRYVGWLNQLPQLPEI
ncbi:MAG: hypothetical protein HQL52_13380 [Magnetococcales bacterium]|nr:hypothetical protein [Magnetococcales bacterium]